MKPSSTHDSGAGALTGQVLDDVYHIKEEVGRGGGGDVYRAQEPGGAYVAVKIVPLRRASSKDLRARLKHEGYCLRRLRAHSNVVEFRELGATHDLAYLAMEFVDGMSLSTLVERRELLTFEEFLPIATGLLEGILHIHAHDVVHRDLRPDNVMLGRDGQVKIIDFGLSQTPGSTLRYFRRAMVGTASYLAPELVRAHHATPASDVYALGALFYLLLSGQKVFAGDSEASILAHHVRGTPRLLAGRVHGDVPEAACDLILACLAKNPADRPSVARCLAWFASTRPQRF